METIKSRYAPLITELIAQVPREAQVSELNVYQEGIASILPYIDTIIHDYLDDCSTIEGLENLGALTRRTKRRIGAHPYGTLFELRPAGFPLPAEKLGAAGDASGESIASSIAATRRYQTQ